MRTSGPGAAHPRGITEVSLLRGTRVPAEDPTRPAVRCRCAGAIWAWGKGCSSSLGVPRRAQRSGLGRLQPPTVTEAPGTVFWLFLPAWAQLRMAEDGTASRMERQICFPNSSWVPEAGDGDAALI